MVSFHTDKNTLYECRVQEYTPFDAIFIRDSPVTFSTLCLMKVKNMSNLFFESTCCKYFSQILKCFRQLKSVNGIYNLDVNATKNKALLFFKIQNFILMLLKTFSKYLNHGRKSLPKAGKKSWSCRLILKKTLCIFVWQLIVQQKRKFNLAQRVFTKWTFHKHIFFEKGNRPGFQDRSGRLGTDDKPHRVVPIRFH